MEEFLPIVRFAVMSDVHVKPNKDCPELERLDKGLKYAYEYAENEKYNALDAVFFVGDFANRGAEDEMLNFKEILDKNIKPGTDVTISEASHEFSAGEDVARKRLLDIFDMNPDVHKVINGFHFISVTSTRGCRFDEPQKKYAEENLRFAFNDDPEKPVFFFQHPHITDTVYGSIDWGEDDLYAILMNYPQIVDFSGHSHAPINDPRSVYQRHFSSFGTGSLSYFELDEFDKYYGTVPPDASQCAQFLIVEVDKDNRVRVRPFDILTGQFFPYVWKIDKPCEPDTFIYTDKRYNTTVRPHFHENTIVDTAKTENGIKITFGQADIDEDMVDDYKITVRRVSDGRIVKQLCVWSGYYLFNMPDDVSVEIKDLEKGKYEAIIKAKGFWKNESDNSLKVLFEI